MPPPELKRFLSVDYPFVIVAPSPGGGGGGGGGPTVIPETVEATGSINIGDYLDANGVTGTTIILCSADGSFCITIPSGTQVLGPDGEPAGELAIIMLNTPPPPPGYVMVGKAYDFLVPGTAFNPAVLIRATFRPADIPDGVNEEDLILGYYDEAKAEWVFLITTVDTDANNASAFTGHFTAFAVLAKVPEEAPAPPAPKPAPAPAPKPAPLPAPVPAPKPAPAPAAETNWWLIGGIIVAVVVIGGVVYFVSRRRAA